MVGLLAGITSGKLISSKTPKMLPVAPSSPLGAIPPILSAVSVVAANVGKKPVTALETKRFPNRFTFSTGYKKGKNIIIKNRKVISTIIKNRWVISTIFKNRGVISSIRSYFNKKADATPSTSPTAPTSTFAASHFTNININKMNKMSKINKKTIYKLTKILPYQTTEVQKLIVDFLTKYKKK